MAEAIEDEIERMRADGFWYTPREGYYVRKRDGLRVVAVDWPDGDVTWMLDPLPIIRPYAVGTCSRAYFEKTHTKA